MSSLLRIWHTPFYRFVALGVLLYFFWNGFLYDYWVKQSSFSFLLTDFFKEQTPALLRFFGYKSSLEGRVVFVNDTPALGIINACNGLNFAGVFLSIVLAFPKPVFNKLIFIPVGLAIIYILNLGRLVGLSLVGYYVPHLFHFAHSWFFVGLIYALVLLMCFIWMSFDKKHESKA